MTVDMTQFYQLCFEGSSELLAEMEALLSKVDLAAPDPEPLNAIFRVAHSIKGGASTFDFTDVGGVLACRNESRREPHSAARGICRTARGGLNLVGSTAT